MANAIRSIQEYIRLTAPEPEALRLAGEEAERHGTSKLSMKEIDAVVQEVRRDKS